MEQNGWDFKSVIDKIVDYANLKNDYGAKGVKELLDRVKLSLDGYLAELQSLPYDENMAQQEPDDYEQILSLRPTGKRKIWNKFDESIYTEKLQGSMLARFAGCTLGAIVEGWKTQDMEDWAKQIGDQFPPINYWMKTRSPLVKRITDYKTSECFRYTCDFIDGVPVDDDIVYTLLDLLIAEDYGIDFNTSDVGEAWVKYLSVAYTAEEIALENLKNGIPTSKVAEVNNPFVQWIGADIRSDGWAYIAPGYPEKAAKMAYNDAYLSHRRNGIYGAMYFSAVESAAFAVDNAEDALKIGLTEIPKECTLAKEIVWALAESKNIHNYKDAVATIAERFKNMSTVHTINNACLTIFGLIIGGNDVTKVLSETVAMGYDNDCTAATAGSIVGAIVGKKGVPDHWYKNFNNTVHSYLIGHETFYIDDLVKRFTALARKVYDGV